MLPPGAMPMPPTCAGQRVAQVIAVQVQRGDDIEIFRARQHLLQGDVGNRILDHDCRKRGLGLFLRSLHLGAAIDFVRAEISSSPPDNPNRETRPRYFMMLPLCTRVTLLRLKRSAYSIA